MLRKPGKNLAPGMDHLAQVQMQPFNVKTLIINITNFFFSYTTLERQCPLYFGLITGNQTVFMIRLQVTENRVFIHFVY